MQRSAKFVRYLPELGYEPVVVTGPGVAAGRWTPTDAALAGDVPPETEVRRVPAPVPGTSGPLRRRVERWAALRTPFERWWIEGAVAVGRGVRDADVVYASMSPFSTAAAAAQLGRHLGVPWVADLRDPWALDEMTIYPTAAHRTLELRRMEAALASAAAVVMNTGEAARVFAKAFPEPAARTVVAIPNGYDAADFAAPAEPRHDRRLRIVHAGYLHTEHGLRARRRLARSLGGAARGVDILPRSHVFLLRGLERLLVRRPELRESVELHLAGVLSAADRAIVESSPLRELVQMPGYLSHEETLGLVRSAHVLFLPMHDVPPGTRARIVPGKAYEYAASGRPILAAVPDGDARDLLQVLPQASLCRPADIECLEASLERLVDHHRRQGPLPTATPAGIERYERRRLTADLAAVFDGVVEAGAGGRPRSSSAGARATTSR